MSTAPSNPEDHDAIDSALGERYYKDRKDLEEKYTDEIIDVIRRAIEKGFQLRGVARRDAHAFDNGCVRAIFRVDPDLDPRLQHGVFIPGREYRAWIRFSNGNSEARSRLWPDARGMAIKLTGVEGPKLLDDEKHTQDFILISHPVFFVDDLERYKATLEAFLKGGIVDQYARAPFKLRGREIWLSFVANLLWISNPLFHQYWSMTPYQLGLDPPRKLAVKYTAKPRAVPKRTLFRRVAPYFRWRFSLKGEMKHTLAGGERCFDFYVQRYVDQRTPIEDSKIEWTEVISKPEHVASIIIPPQDLMSAEQGTFCENLSFSPWHGLSEHKPLGLVNRVRKRVYLAISEHRHNLNRASKLEPTGDERFGPP
jgi:hypothetical protein